MAETQTAIVEVPRALQPTREAVRAALDRRGLVQTGIDDMWREYADVTGALQIRVAFEQRHRTSPQPGKPLDLITKIWVSPPTGSRWTPAVVALGHEVERAAGPGVNVQPLPRSAGRGPQVALLGVVGVVLLAYLCLFSSVRVSDVDRNIDCRNKTPDQALDCAGAPSVDSSGHPVYVDYDCGSIAGALGRQGNESGTAVEAAIDQACSDRAVGHAAWSAVIALAAAFTVVAAGQSLLRERR